MQFVGKFDPLGILNQIKEMDLRGIIDELILHAMSLIRALLLPVQFFRHLVDQSCFDLRLLLIQCALDTLSGSLKLRR